MRQSLPEQTSGLRLRIMSEMNYRRLGNSGLVVSVVGLGCNNFGRKLDADGTKAVVDAALKGRRDAIVLATKFGGNMEGLNGPARGARGSRRYIARAVESSLQRLGTD